MSVTAYRHSRPPPEHPIIMISCHWFDAAPALLGWQTYDMSAWLRTSRHSYRLGSLAHKTCLAAEVSARLGTEDGVVSDGAVFAACLQSFVRRPTSIQYIPRSLQHFTPCPHWPRQHYPLQHQLLSMPKRAHSPSSAPQPHSSWPPKSCARVPISCV